MERMTQGPLGQCWKTQVKNQALERGGYDQGTEACKGDLQNPTDSPTISHQDTPNRPRWPEFGPRSHLKGNTDSPKLPSALQRHSLRHVCSPHSHTQSMKENTVQSKIVNQKGQGYS